MMNYKKIWLKNDTYMPKPYIKHKHNYCIKYILEITNKNIHASGNYYNTKEYHEVLKCSLCDSFIPNYKEKYHNETIYDVKNIDNSLPLITASTNAKNPYYDFCDLYDVKINSTKSVDTK